MLNIPNSKRLFLVFIFNFSLSQAQQEFELAFYNYHLGIYNPAIIGSQDASYLNTSFRTQWMGIKDSPRIQALTIGIPSLENKISYGIMISNDNTFIERQTRFYGTFSFHIVLNNNWDLNLGISGGGNNYSSDFTQLDNLQEKSDEVFENFSRFNPNIGVGLYLKKNNFFLSLSVPQLLSTLRNKNSESIVITTSDRPHIYAITGLRIPINEDFFWINSGLVRYVNNSPTTLTINTGLGYRTMDFTLGYQFNVGLTGTFIIQELTDKGIAIGYAYQMPSTREIQSISSGSHEILLRIRLAKP